jgi:hypothetical protein
VSVKPVQPEVLPPGAVPRQAQALANRQRLRGAGGAFRDENLEFLSRLLDTWFRVPGTNIRFGLDGIIGFVPGIGDFLAGAASCIIVLAAYVRGVPLVTVARMVANVAIEVVVGMVPILGNLFDIGWRANRRNYHLLELSLADARRDTWKDWVFLVVLGACLMLLAMLPFLLLLWVGGSLLHGLHAPGW